MNQTSDVILEAEGIVKGFPGVKALSGASLQVRSGRLVAVLGENGAGKSTLMNVLSGVLQADDGEIRIDGKAVRFANPREAQKRGIGIVYQELNLVPYLSIAENVYLGREPTGRSGLIDLRTLHANTAAMLKRVDLTEDPRTRVADLRVGQQQLVEIAKALSAEARVIIFDEPTSSLSSHEVETLFSVIRDLKRQGVGIAYITHKFEELAAICDDVVVMRDGAVVGGGRISDMSRDTIIRLMAGRESKDVFHKSPTVPGVEILRAENVSLLAAGPGRPAFVDAVSISVRQGEVVGVFGLVGAGRTELLECLFGVHGSRASGDYRIDGAPVEIRSPKDAIAAGLAFAPEDRKSDGLVLPMSVGANASLGIIDQCVRYGLIDERLEAGRIKPFVNRFRVRTPSLQQPIVHLSGGNQQKVILAKWLATGPRILLLDEPTRGIDVNAKREIYAFVDELAQAGLGLIVVSSDLPEVLTLADRVVVMCEGRKTAEFTRADATPERVLHAALPDRNASSN